MQNSIKINRIDSNEFSKHATSNFHTHHLLICVPYFFHSPKYSEIKVDHVSPSDLQKNIVFFIKNKNLAAKHK